MTSANGTIGEEAAAVDYGNAWETLRKSDEIQFEPLGMPETPETPDWLRNFFEWLGDLLEPLANMLGAGWPVLKWGMLGLLCLGAVYFLWRLLAPVARLRWQRSKTQPVETDEINWLPDRGEAMALLEDADRLAREGRFDEATHLLLKRSVGQISNVRPEWLDPSSTAREIAALPQLPGAAATAFAIIAQRVETSLFALRPLDAADWDTARAAYADFALADFRTAS